MNPRSLLRIIVQTFNVQPAMPCWPLPDLPEDLYDEIIGFLWDDIPSLKACSLANRIMTVPSQKRLFYCVALRELPPNYHNYVCGTPYNFWQLLLRSPHIATYVVSLHVVDNFRATIPGLGALGNSVPGSADGEVDDGAQYIGYKLENGEGIFLDAPLVPTSGSYHDDHLRSMVQSYRWLPTEKLLPLCAPLLRNL